MGGGERGGGRVLGPRGSRNGDFIALGLESGLMLKLIPHKLCGFEQVTNAP